MAAGRLVDRGVIEVEELGRALGVVVVEVGEGDDRVAVTPGRLQVGLEQRRQVAALVASSPVRLFA